MTIVKSDINGNISVSNLSVLFLEIFNYMKGELYVP